MRVLAAMALLGACGGGGGPSCKDAVTAAATRLGHADSKDTTMMIGTCEQHGWSQAIRRCVRDAPTATDIATCVTPALDDGKQASRPAAPPPPPPPTPSQSTRDLVAKAPEPIVVRMFYRHGKGLDDSVEQQVVAYFTALGPKVTIVRHDRMLDVELGVKYRVMQDGVIVLGRGTGSDERFQTIQVSPDPQRAKVQLHRFDREVAFAIAKLSRGKRRAYLVTGHGEMNDPTAQAAVKAETARKTTALSRRLVEWGLDPRDLNAAELAAGVPPDATVVLLLAPTDALQPSEWESLAHYLDGGGSLLITLDPKSKSTLGPLGGRFGLTYDASHLVDDKSFVPQKKTVSDHQYAVTNRYATHPSTSLVARSTQGVVLIDSGVLIDAPFTGAGAAPTKTITIRSMDTSFLDLDGDFAFDLAGRPPEKRQAWSIAAALEGPSAGKDGFRALVFADTDLFADVMVQGGSGARLMMVGAPLLDDGLRWLARDEQFVVDQVVADDPVAGQVERLTRESEEADRRVVRALRAVIESSPQERDDANRDLKKAQDEQARLREQLEKAKAAPGRK